MSRRGLHRDATQLGKARSRSRSRRAGTGERHVSRETSRRAGPHQHLEPLVVRDKDVGQGCEHADDHHERAAEVGERGRRVEGHNTGVIRKASAARPRRPG